MGRFSEAKSQIEAGEIIHSASESCPSKDRKRLADEGFKPIYEAHLRIAAVYDQLKDPWKKKSLRNAIATDPDVLKVEKAVSREAEILLNDVPGNEKPTEIRLNDVSENRKQLAMKRIIEGMDYWQKLLLKRIGKPNNR